MRAAFSLMPMVTLLKKKETKTINMKKLIFIFAMLIVINLHAQDKSKIPIEAKTAFAKQFSGATNIKWGKEDKDFEVDFISEGKKMSAIYNAKGNFKESEQALVATEMPANVMIYFKAHYVNVAIKETVKITKANGEINFEIGIKAKDILFNANGNFIKEVKD